MLDLYYQDAHGTPLVSIAFRPIRTGIFRRTRFRTDRDVYYRNPKYLKDHPYGIVCTAGLYDGYSMPKILRALSLGVMSPYMPVVECTLPHDVVCEHQLLTKQLRRELFKDAYDDAVRQFYGGQQPDRRRDKLIRGVVVGSKYFGAC